MKLRLIERNHVYTPESMDMCGLYIMQRNVTFAFNIW
jgi:hypothetical protein